MPRARAYDPQEVLTLYLCGMTITAIADDAGVPRKTIYSFLRTTGVEIRPDPRGVARTATCPNGHSREHMVPKKRKNRPDTQECGICRRERDQRSRAKKRAQEQKENK